MPTARVQPSFAAGVLGPGLHGRVDIAKYDVGLRVGYNVFVHAHGGLSNRAGTEYIADVMDHTKAHRILPFTRSETENYIMLMGDTEMKIISDGGVVQSGGSDYVATTPYSSTDLFDLDYVQSVDVMFFAHIGTAPQEMNRASATSWTFAALDVDPQLTAPTGLSASSGMAGTEAYSYKVSPIDGGVEGFASASTSVASAADLSTSGQKITVSWTGSADEYNVYRERNGIYGFIGFTDGTTFVDDNIDADLTITPVQSAGLFGGSGDWPSKVTLFQQRIVFAHSTNNPETVWGSRIGDFRNFTRSRRLRDDDRLEIALNGAEINRVKGLLPLRELLAFTSSGEFSITGPGGALISTNPIQTQYGYSGAVDVRPLVVEDTALFVDRTGRNVRDLRYAFEQDGYNGNDLTIFASHFFEGKEIAAWTYAKNPYSIIWVALNDGTLLSFTYKREHQVWAWCEHDVGGEVEDVAAIREGAHDALYLIVKRTINGTTRRYVERMHERSFDDATDAFFVDCGLTYDGAAATTISGLTHLEGETVCALADGNVVANLVVASGQITLPAAASKVHVGLPYYSQVETLPPAIDLQDVGSARGRPHVLSSVAVQMESTRGIKVSGANARFNEILQTGGDMSDVIALFTGMKTVPLFPDINTEGTLIIRQDYPLPMTILGVRPEITVGRSG